MPTLIANPTVIEAAHSRFPVIGENLDRGGSGHACPEGSGCRSVMVLVGSTNDKVAGEIVGGAYVFQRNGACGECHTVDQRGPLAFASTSPTTRADLR